jgi:hypothetical protein
MHYDHDEDDGDTVYDYPYRPAYPRREAFTMTLAAIIVISAVSWCVWKLL